MLPILISLFLALQTAPPQQSPAPKPAAPPAYRDAKLDLTYAYPPDFQAADLSGQIMDAAGQELQKQSGSDSDKEATKKAMGCVSIPFTATHKTGENDAEVIVMISLDFGCLGIPPTVDVLKPMAESTLTQGLQKIGQATFVPTVNYKLDGHEAVFAQGSVANTNNGKAAYSGVACTLLEHNAICWVMMTSAKARLPVLFSTAVTLSKGSATPIVPAALVPEQTTPKN